MALTQIKTAGIANDAVGAEHIETLDADLKFVDSAKVVLGTGDDFKIYHNGTDNYIIATGGDIRFDTGSAELARITQGGDIELPDNGEYRCGTGDDLKIYHNGTNSYIENSTGQLQIKVDEFRLLNNAGSENMIDASADGAVKLYHNGVKTFETGTGGATLYGIEGGEARFFLYADEGDDNADKWRVEADTAGNFNIHNLADGSWDRSIACASSGNVELFYDDSKKFETENDGVNVIDSNSSVHVRMTSSDGVAGFLLGSGSTVIGLGDNSGHYHVKGTKDNATELYYDNSKKFETYSFGVEVSGNLWIQDGSSTGNRVTLGTGGDLNLYHDGSHSVINNATGDLYQKCANDQFFRVAGDESGIDIHGNGAVELYYDNVKKFETNAYGCKSIQHMYFDDSHKVQLGSSQDLEIYHDGTNSYLHNNTGRLRLESDNTGIGFYKGAGSETLAMFNVDGACELYHDNSVKLSTASHGVSIIDDELRIGTNSGSGTDCGIRLGSHGTNTDTHGVIAYDAGDNYISIVVSGEAHGSAGIKVTNGGAVNCAAFNPHADNTYNMGATENRWSTIYAQNALNTSDRNLKNTIQTSDLGLSFINQLNPVSYKFNLYEGQVQDTRTHYGLIAQEVEDVIKKEGKTIDDFAAVVAEGGKYSLAYSEMISPLVKAIQELSAKVSALEAK